MHAFGEIHLLKHAVLLLMDERSCPGTWINTTGLTQPSSSFRFDCFSHPPDHHLAGLFAGKFFFPLGSVVAQMQAAVESYVRVRGYGITCCCAQCEDLGCFVAYIFSISSIRIRGRGYCYMYIYIHIHMLHSLITSHIATALYIVYRHIYILYIKSY